MSTQEEIEELIKEEQRYYNNRMGRDTSGWPIQINRKEVAEAGFREFDLFYEPFDEE